MHITAPNREMYHLLLNEGLYAGFEAKFSNRLIKQIDPYVTMKNIEMISATAFTSPMSTKKKAIMHVTSVALTGSPFLILSLLSQLFSLGIGIIRSAEIALSVLGATITLPNADEIVAAARPIGIIGHQIAISAIIS
jgi:hypothetical protein